MEVLFICTGNTCRSCMAEAMARHEAEKLNMDVVFSSAGIYACKGDSASYNAFKVMKDMSIDLGYHIAAPLTEGILERADLVLTMTSAHKNAILSLYPLSSEKVFTLLEFVGEKGDISDPFGGDVSVYRECSLQLKNAIIKLLLKLKDS